MKQKLMAGLLSMTLLLGLAACTQSPGNLQNADGSTPDGVQDGEYVDAGENIMGAASAVPFNMVPKEKDTYPYMGISISLPEEIRNAVLDNAIFMQPYEDTEYTDLADHSESSDDLMFDPTQVILRGGYIELHFLPEAMRDRVPRPNMIAPDFDFQDWFKDAIPMARIGMYQKEGFTEAVLDESGYKNHQKLGENSEFVYYLSSNDRPETLPADAEHLFSLIGKMAEDIEIFEVRQVDESYFGITTPEIKAVSQVGDFQTTTITGEAIDQTVFSQAKLTMVNVWTTWCSPCIEELPDLGELSDELKETGTQIIGIVQDTAGGKGKPDEEMIEFAKTIVERTKVNYPCLVPDSNLSEGLLQGIQGFPTTWFVDSEGNVVGDQVLGSNTKEDWLKIIQERLAEVDG